MNHIARLALLTGLPLMLAGTAAAKSTTGTTSTPTGNTGTGNTGTGNAGGNSGFQGQTMEGAPTINTGTSSGANVQGTNSFAGYYANPQYAGRFGASGNDNPGGFGNILTSGSGGGTTRTSGAAPTSRTNTGNTNTGRATGGTSGTNRTGTSTTGASLSPTGTASRTIGGTAAGGFGGTTTGQGGRATGGFGQQSGAFGGQSGAFGGQGGRATGGFGQQSGLFGGTGQQNTSIIAQQARPVSYTLNLDPSLRAPAPAIPAMHAELNGVIARSTVLSNPRGITANYDGKFVILRGSVKDEEEKMTAEGIVRLTPGVRGVKNELTYPKPVSNP